MKPIRWSLHALQNLADREIPRHEADEALLNPELTLTAAPSRQIFMRRYFDPRFGQEMLVRAVVEETAEERLVITV